MPNDPSIQSTAETAARVGGDAHAVSDTCGQVVFEVIVATMWSVGELVAAELERSRAALASLQLQPRRGGSAFGTIAAGALPLADLEFEQLAPIEGRLAYAAAEWVAATSLPSDRRAQFMRGLRLRLRLSDHDSTQLSALARSIDVESESARDAFGRLTARVG